MTNTTNADPRAAPYGVLLADPPWSRGQQGKYGAAAHYPLMSDEEIIGMGPAIRNLTADNAVCWLWVTNATIRTGHDVLEAWGFRYASILTWVKPRLGLGSPLRNMTEHVLVGIRGSMPPAFRSQGTWLWAPVQPPHSHKPEELYDVIERVHPGQKSLELFARRPRRGWHAWGDSIASDLDIPGYPVPDSPATRGLR